MNSLIGWAFKTAREKKKMPENRLLQIAYLINWPRSGNVSMRCIKTKPRKVGGLTSML